MMTLVADVFQEILARKVTQQIQMQLSDKQKAFSQFFFAVLKSLLNFEHFRKKDDPRT